MFAVSVRTRGPRADPLPARLCSEHFHKCCWLQTVAVLSSSRGPRCCFIFRCILESAAGCELASAEGLKSNEVLLFTYRCHFPPHNLPSKDSGLRGAGWSLPAVLQPWCVLGRGEHSATHTASLICPFHQRPTLLWWVATGKRGSPQSLSILSSRIISS